MSLAARFRATALVAVLSAQSLSGQTTGQIVGIARDARDSAALDEVRITVAEGRWSTVTGPDGEFVLVGLPPGFYQVRARRIGFREWEASRVAVRSGTSTRIVVWLQPTAVGLPEITVIAAAQPLLATDVTAGRQVVTRAQLAAEPIDDLGEMLELRTGVGEGHFRGGRIGQETYVIDGVDVRDQLAASTSGTAYQLAPTAVQEVSVFTSGFSADQPSALSGVVNLVTRSGSPDRWEGRLEWVTDEWAPGGLRRGYTRAGLSAGGPVVGGVTAFVDLTVFGQADRDPRVRGLTCLDVPFLCPVEQRIIPHQQGDRYFVFGRFDVPISSRWRGTLALSRNRDQHELYATRFKYGLAGYLAEREVATLLTGTLTGTFRLSGSRAMRITGRVAVGRTDRYLGVPDTVQGLRLGRVRVADLRFRGESFTRSPVAEQIASGRSVPGYVQPSDSGRGSPFGAFGADLFVTDGTSGIAQWSQNDFVDLTGTLQALVSPRHDLKLGGNLKLFRVQSYQRVTAALPGSAPNFVRFYPRTAAVYLHNTLHALETATIDLGIRVEAFQPRLAAPENRIELTAPVEATRWRVMAHPRVGFAMPLGIVGIDRAAVHWNFGRFAQPPDFQFFFDQALDDSLNTAVRRQGNPMLGFERAVQYELGIDYLVAGDVVIQATGFLKDLSGITTSGIGVAARGRTFTNLDFGRVEGLELQLRARLPSDGRLEVGYALQRAVGVVSSAFDSTADDRTRVEIPLQFDRRHSIDFNGVWALPGALRMALAATVGSGLPVPGAADRRLPWSAAVSARVTRDLRWGPRVIQLVLEGRNLLNANNLVTARVDGLLPDVAAIEARATAETAEAVAIPRESPLYVQLFDTNGNGLLEPAEQTAARRAALLDSHEPTLLYGEARQVRLGAQVLF